MKKWTSLGTTALCAVVIGTAAGADVTPEEVWQNWQEVGASYGQTVAATSAVREGDTLVVKGMSMSVTGEGGGASATIEEVRFADNGDGTVKITMSDSYPLTMTVPADPELEGSTPSEIAVLVSQPGMVITAGGDLTETSYAIDAPSINIKLDSVEAVKAEAVDVTMDMTVSALVATYLVSGAGDAKTVDSTFSAASLSGVVDGKDATAADTFRMTFSVADMAGTGKGTVLGLAAMANPAEALKAGLSSQGSFTYGTNSLNMDVVEAGVPTTIKASGTSGSISVAVDKNGLSYGAGGTGVKAAISGPQIPFPEAAMELAEVAFDFRVPLAKADTPADFAVLVKMVGLTVSNDIWGMIDPTVALPRDPATLIIDAKGKATMKVDLLDPVQTEALGDAAPGELNALDITELRLTAAGADVTGSGSLTFDNTDLVTFGGLPAPTGVINVQIVGGNGLIDKLVAMGLVPEDQAQGARMMLSMFANAAEGAVDTLTSVIEFKDKGLYANGQRLQ